MSEGKWNVRLLLAGLVGLLGYSAQAQPADEYSSEHGDIGLAYEGGELELHYHLGDGAVINGLPIVGDAEFEPGDIFVRVNDNTGANYPSTPANFGFTGMTPDGNPATSDFWFLPQAGTAADAAGAPFLGIASEEMGPAIDWVGGVSYTLESVNFTAQGTGVPGQGHFSLWQDGLTPTVYMASSDGIDGSDVLTTGIGGHDHFNYGFTEEGVYEVTITASATHTVDGEVSDTATFWFAVGDSTVIPEPSSLAILGMAGALAFRRRR